MPDLGLLLCLVALGIVTGALLWWFEGWMEQDEQRYRRTGRGDD